MIFIILKYFIIVFPLKSVFGAQNITWWKIYHKNYFIIYFDVFT
jgi:hypothetical protein